MTVLAMLAASAACYAWGLVRARRARRAVSPFAALSFALGLATLAAALLGPVDDRADASLAWHMGQHILLLEIAAPLLLLGAPHRVALAALPPRAAARLARALNSTPVRVLTHPAVAWLLFAAVLYGTHFSPLYEYALEHEPVHECEHLLYLVSGIIFFAPLLAVAPAPHAPAHPVRLLSVFLAIPMSAFLGFVFYASTHVMYPYYAKHPGALADQQDAGALMWIAGAGPMFAVLMWLVADWGARERRLGEISNALLAAEER